MVVPGGWEFSYSFSKRDGVSVPPFGAPAEDAVALERNARDPMQCVGGHDRQLCAGRKISGASAPGILGTAGVREAEDNERFSASRWRTTPPSSTLTRNSRAEAGAREEHGEGR